MSSTTATAEPAPASARPAGARLSVTALVLTIALVVLNIVAWQWINPAQILPVWYGKVPGVAYSGFRIGQDPNRDRFPTEAELREDMTILARFTDRIRTYTTLDNEAAPRLAAEYGLRVTAGAWLDKRLENNEMELAMLIAEAKANPHVDRLMVGNESILRGDMTPKEVAAYIREVKAKVKGVPVSTAEPWHVWLRYPELARTVDFITVHLLPYWEGLPVTEAVDYVFDRLNELQEAYPKKRIVIGEVGWPSRGDRRDGSVASPENQAQFIREFLLRAAMRGVEFYFMEAFDQPWKIEHEGRAGAYWGLFNADRSPKFSLDGPVVPDPHWSIKAGVSALLAIPLMLGFATRFRRFSLAGKVFFCTLIQAGCALAVWLVCLPFGHYLGPLDWAMLAILLPALVAMISILLANGFEFTEVLWNRGWQRRFAPRALAPGETEPFVSIHLPCYNEPPDMVIATLASLQRLDYRNFEVLVVDNNTKDPAVWAPVKSWCEKAGPQFRFFHLDDWPGFKAGALNFALRETDPRAEVVGVVDADYVVEPNWLSTLVPHFAESKVAVVQAPQAHRDYEHSPFQRMCNWEFDGFFRIGMHHRNERNAIIQHGTMTLVRATALRSTGGWAEWCICEDAELGLRLMHHGFETRYVDAVLGRGLAPADFKAFKTQRMRWAFGAMQILKGRWSWLVKKGPLDGGQRYHFLTGWFSWFADALHLVFTTGALLWTAGMIALPKYFSMPLTLFLIPVLGFFACKALFGPVLYRARVDCSWADVLGASLASMGLSHAIARGVFAGLIQKKGTFIRTTKGVAGGGWLGAFAPVREEGLMVVAFVIAIVGFIDRMGTHNYEALLWIGVLAAQAIPYLSSLACAAIAARDAERQRRSEAAPRTTPDLRPSATVIPMPLTSPLPARATGTWGGVSARVQSIDRS